jgi:hypothetical protein
MARTKAGTAKAADSKPGTSPSSRKKKTATASLDALQSKKAAVRDQFSNAGKTKTAYKGYVDRGRAILADLVRERRLKEKTGWKCPEGIDTNLLATAFEGSPDKHSALALELYLTQKCIAEGLGKSTGEGIHGAWAKYWDEL